MLGGEPLPVTANMRVWAQGEGGRVAQSLVQGLLLPKDVHFFSGANDKSLAKRLQWHTIVIIHLLAFLLFTTKRVYSPFIYSCGFCAIRPRS